ncbi:hypothetical protein B0H12DRAFT_1077742 [Mycena haematopus]|nr:hypothetical protein B0H12DRAFT_1077742 [Mycena haematopus]
MPPTQQSLRVPMPLKFIQDTHSSRLVFAILQFSRVVLFPKFIQDGSQDPQDSRRSTVALLTPAKILERHFLSSRLKTNQASVSSVSFSHHSMSSGEGVDGLKDSLDDRVIGSLHGSLQQLHILGDIERMVFHRGSSDEAIVTIMCRSGTKGPTRPVFLPPPSLLACLPTHLENAGYNAFWRVSNARV